VLTGLWHDAIGGTDDKDGGVHLGGTGDHVLDVVSVPWAVNVGVVTGFGLVLFVSGVDGDTTSSLFWGAIDSAVADVFSITFDTTGLFANKGKDVADGGGKSGFAVVDVTDGANVNVDTVTIEFLFCHCVFSSKNGFLEKQQVNHRASIFVSQ
jgi:hypothetical protein